MMKRLTALIISASALFSLYTPAHAAEAWRDAFVSRIINTWATDPTCTDVVMTDLDKNGVPEAFLVSPGTLGQISTGITMKDNTIIQIGVPHNISGDCLKDLTVYENGDNYVYVGKEIARYANVISYYELNFNGHSLTAKKTSKGQYSLLKPAPYNDMYSSDFFVDGYPNRSKLQKFIYSYQSVNALTIEASDAKISVNGTATYVPGYIVDNNNYYKIRDIAMLLRSTNKKFNVEWDNNARAINIVTGKKYVPVGGELEGQADLDNLEIVLVNVGSVLLNGEPVSIHAYNINGNSFFRIRDLANLLGFSVGWDDESSTITID